MLRGVLTSLEDTVQQLDPGVMRALDTALDTLTHNLHKLSGGSGTRALVARVLCVCVCVCVCVRARAYLNMHLYSMDMFCG